MNYLIGCNWCRLSLPYFLQIGILFAKILLFMDAYFAYCPCSTGDFPISGCDQLLQPPLIAHSIQLYDCKFQLRTPSFFGFVKDFHTKPPIRQNPQNWNTFSRLNSRIRFNKADWKTVRSTESTASKADWRSPSNL